MLQAAKRSFRREIIFGSRLTQSILLFEHSGQVLLREVLKVLVGEGVQLLGDAAREYPLDLLFATVGFVTRIEYLVIMNTVRITDLKSRLSEHLRKVRRGHSLTVLDGDTPIARIVPYEEIGPVLTVRSPLPRAPKLTQVPLPSRLRLRKDIVKLLLEERQPER